MDILSAFSMISPTEWLTVGLVIFAGVQIAVQIRQEHQRRRERIEDREEAEDRAFHYAWAEHYQLEGLADRLERSDLIELAVLGVLRPQDVLPHNWGDLTRSLASLGREAGTLGGFAVALCHDVEHAVALFVGSVEHLTADGPEGMQTVDKVAWLRKYHGQSLEPWERSIKEQVRQLSLMVFDAARQSPRANADRELHFSDDLTSDFARSAVESLMRASAVPPDDGSQC